MEKREATKAALLAQYSRYPKLQLADLFKFLYQSAFGCEHLVKETGAVKEYIEKEFAERCPMEGDLVEPLDGDWCRVSLKCLEDGLSADTFARLFFFSAEQAKDGEVLLEEKLSVLRELVKKGSLPFDEAETEEAIETWKRAGYPACHHSEAFRACYAPAYRLIKKTYVPFLPLFIRIDCMLKRGRVTLAIEGGSASGKSTLGELLEKVYGCTMFHMDDFFLRPGQRTPERLAEPGGNVDRERFLKEVLAPLEKNERVMYRRFDCGTFTLNPPIEKRLSQLNVTEGVYSMHPELAGYYNLSVFLDITPELQKKRIGKRNSLETAERFLAEWIPMERGYFKAHKVKERCDLTIVISE